MGELDPISRGQTAAAAAAFEVDQRLRRNVKIMRGMWVRLAEDLYRFHAAEMWRDLGHDTFEKWLADPGLELNERYVYDLIATYRQLVVERNVEPSRLQELHISKVREVLPAIRREIVTVDEGLDDAEQLVRSDLELRYRGKSSPTNGTPGPDTSTEVRTEQEPEWRRCGCCGSLLRVSPDTGN